MFSFFPFVWNPLCFKSTLLNRFQIWFGDFSTTRFSPLSSNLTHSRQNDECPAKICGLCADGIKRANSRGHGSRRGSDPRRVCWHRRLVFNIFLVLAVFQCRLKIRPENRSVMSGAKPGRNTRTRAEKTLPSDSGEHPLGTAAQLPHKKERRQQL